MLVSVAAPAFPWLWGPGLPSLAVSERLTVAPFLRSSGSEHRPDGRGAGGATGKGST